MLSTVHLLLALYLGLILIVSSLAKFDNLPGFRYTLYRYGFIPSRIVPSSSIAVPAVQFMLGMLLISGLVPTLAAILTTVAFTIFLLVEMFLLKTKRSTNCGCYGVAFPLPVDPASIVASVLLVCVACTVTAISMSVDVALKNHLILAGLTAIGVLLVTERMMVRARTRVSETTGRQLVGG